MRRAVRLAALTAALAALGGCASWNDRYGHVRTDPVLWFLGGAPTEVQLDWPRREVPTLAPADLARPGRARSNRIRSTILADGRPSTRPTLRPANRSSGPIPDVDESRCPGACDTSPAPALGDRGGVDRRERRPRPPLTFPRRFPRAPPAAVAPEVRPADGVASRRLPLSRRGPGADRVPRRPDRARRPRPLAGLRGHVAAAVRAHRARGARAGALGRRRRSATSPPRRASTVDRSADPARRHARARARRADARVVGAHRLRRPDRHGLAGRPGRDRPRARRLAARARRGVPPGRVGGGEAARARDDPREPLRVGHDREQRGPRRSRRGERRAVGRASRAARRSASARSACAGSRAIRESLVRNFSTIAPGQPFSQEALDAYIRRLNATAYFASVQGGDRHRPGERGRGGGRRERDRGAVAAARVRHRLLDRHGVPRQPVVARREPRQPRPAVLARRPARDPDPHDRRALRAAADRVRLARLLRRRGGAHRHREPGHADRDRRGAAPVDRRAAAVGVRRRLLRRRATAGRRRRHEGARAVRRRVVDAPRRRRPDLADARHDLPRAGGRRPARRVVARVHARDRQVPGLAAGRERERRHAPRGGGRGVRQVARRRPLRAAVPHRRRQHGARLRLPEPRRAGRRRDRARPLLRARERGGDALVRRELGRGGLRRRRQRRRRAERPRGAQARLRRRRAHPHADRPVPRSTSPTARTRARCASTSPWAWRSDGRTTRSARGGSTGASR